ncbi:MAG: hypothetical protein HXS46_01115 [Theionarchaea archaeon]|nr:hypothetical protein [Theionarchaea archaeon]
MDLEALSYFFSQIAGAIDTGKHQDISVEEVKDRIRKADLIPYLTEKTGVDLNLFVEEHDLAIELNEKLQCVLEKFEAQKKKWNVEKNGLCFLIVLTTQIIQSKQKVLTVLQSKQTKEGYEMEYKELCKDWRLRDKYVLDKLSAAGILFALLGFAIATAHESEYWIRSLLATVGVFFSLVLCISVFKDILYRDSTEKLIRCLSDALRIENSFEKVKMGT